MLSTPTPLVEPGPSGRTRPCWSNPTKLNRTRPRVHSQHSSWARSPPKQRRKRNLAAPGRARPGRDRGERRRRVEVVATNTWRERVGGSGRRLGRRLLKSVRAALPATSPIARPVSAEARAPRSGRAVAAPKQSVRRAPKDSRLRHTRNGDVNTSPCPTHASCNALGDHAGLTPKSTLAAPA